MIGRVAPDVGKANGLRLSKERALCIRLAPSLHPKTKHTKRMEVKIILSVALAAAMIVVVLVLVAVIVYQRWQIGDKNATLGRFIDENEKMRRKIERMGIL